jgi:hypothetical protein
MRVSERGRARGDRQDRGETDSAKKIKHLVRLVRRVATSGTISRTAAEWGRHRLARVMTPSLKDCVLRLRLGAAEPVLQRPSETPDHLV